MHIVRRAETQIEQMEPTWFDKLRRACGLQRFDVVARIAMSLKDVETAMEMIHALAFECFKQRSSFLRAILREFRLLNVSPDLAVELFRNTEQWFRAQSPRIAEWNEILYALVLANRYEEAWELVTSMEKGLDPRLPVPELFCTKSFCFLTRILETSFLLDATKPSIKTPGGGRPELLWMDRPSRQRGQLILAYSPLKWGVS